MRKRDTTVESAQSRARREAWEIDKQRDAVAGVGRFPWWAWAGVAFAAAAIVAVVWWGL